MVDAGPTATRLNQMMSAGKLLSAIAKRTQVARSTLDDIAKGRVGRTGRPTHDAVVAEYRSHSASPSRKGGA